MLVLRRKAAGRCGQRPISTLLLRVPMNLLLALWGYPTALAAALLYAVLAGAHARMTRGQTHAVLGAAWLLHMLVLVRAVVDEPARFGFAPTLSVTAWLVLTVYMVQSRLYSQFAMRWGGAGLVAAAVLLALVFPGATYPVRSSWLVLHWVLGIASYGMVGVAVLHAWLMQRQEKSIREGSFTEAAMPLLMLERLTFAFLGMGFVLLSATLAAGVWFAQALGQVWVWNHKTVFALLAWSVMAVLLWGRWQLGWRARMAVRMLYLGAGFLLLSYVGAHFVLEVVLRRL